MNRKTRKPAGDPITNLAQLESLRGEWEEVHADSRLRSPVLTLEYLQLWYSCFAEPEQVRIYRATSDDETIGFLPLVLRRKGPIRILSSLTNDHCLYSEPLVRQGYETPFPSLVLNNLLRDSASWDVLEYRFSYSFSDFPGLFTDDLLDSASLRSRRKTQPTYAQLLDQPFEDYYNLLSYKSRKTIRGVRNRLAKAGSYRYLLYQGQEAVEQWQRFKQIEDSSWKGRAGSSIARESEAYQHYYDGLMTLLAKRNALQLYFLELDDQPIAGGVGYSAGDTFHFLKSGYDEKYRALSPSILLMMYMIERLPVKFPQFRRLHLFPWSYGYKDRYSHGRGTCIDTIVYGRTVRGKTQLILDRAKDTVRRIPGTVKLATTVRRFRRKA